AGRRRRAAPRRPAAGCSAAEPDAPAAPAPAARRLPAWLLQAEAQARSNMQTAGCLRRSNGVPRPIGRTAWSLKFVLAYRRFRRRWRASLAGGAPILLHPAPLLPGPVDAPWARPPHASSRRRLRLRFLARRRLLRHRRRRFLAPLDSGQPATGKF